MAEQRLDERTVELCDEARDYAQRMSARLMEHKVRELAAVIEKDAGDTYK